MPSPTNPLQALRRALDELGSGKRSEALESLLLAWRQTRAPGVAELVDELSRALEAERPAMALGGNKQQAWNDALERATAVELPRLYEALPDTRVGLAQVRLAQLRKRPADPRLARWLWAWIRDVPFQGTAARGFYIEATEQLGALADSRFDADILAARDNDHSTGHYTVARLRRVGTRTALQAFLELAGEVEGRIVDPLRAEEQALVDALATKIAKLGVAVEKAEQTGAALLAAVYADPGDDAPRLVYADYLQRSGDPRGEFIALQIARHGAEQKPSRRERELQKRYADAWTDGLEPFILKSGREFRRGFLAACRYCHPRVEPDPIGLPAWATIEDLDGSGHIYMSGTARIILQPHMRALRVVRGVTHDDLRAIADHDQPLAIEWLHLRRGDNRKLLATLRRAKSLARLHTLDLVDSGLGPDEVAEIVAGLPDLRVIDPLSASARADPRTSAR